MSSYLEPLSPISPLCKSLVGLPWAAPDSDSEPARNAARPPRPRLPSRPQKARASCPSTLHGPRAPCRSRTVSNENQRPCSSSRVLSAMVRPLPAPPPCPSTSTRRYTYRPLPRPPSPPVPPPPSPVLPVDSSFEHELRLSQKHVLRLAIPDSPELGVIIVSPLTGTSSDLSGPSIHRTVGTDPPCVDETGRWMVACEPLDGSTSQRPTLSCIDTSVKGQRPLPAKAAPSAHHAVLSPIEKYYDEDPVVLGEVDSNRSRRTTNESYVVVDPIPEAREDPPSPPRRSGHARIASDLSKKLKRYSCKWIREKSGRRWVEEDYGTVLQKLRRLK